MSFSQSFSRQQSFLRVGLLSTLVWEARDQEISIGEIISHQERVMWDSTVKCHMVIEK